jgi:uncharacterized protein YdiU (UPF0061 family)
MRLPIHAEDHAVDFAMTSTPASAPAEVGWQFDNSYTKLPEIFYVRAKPAPVRSPGLAVLNRPLASAMGLNPDALESELGASIFAGNYIPDGAEPIAEAYAGHQFGHFTMLGDGRAVLLGEHRTPDGARLDVQLKGSGQTPFSRRGDGRATLGPMLREYIISEAMHSLGIPTTRSLAVATTGETVYRETALPGAVLARVAASHIRVGTFQFAAASRDETAVQVLADYTLRRHYPELADAEVPYLALLEGVVERQASLIAKWLMVGFIHGVMNTDNMALSGETIDYGPCAFMDVYDPATVFSSIDRQGRYAYGNQPGIAQWNLTRFAETLLPLFDKDEDKAVSLATEVLESFGDRFKQHWLSGMRGKLGLVTAEEEDNALINSLLALMQQHRADYTRTFRALASGSPQGEPLFELPEFREWREQWSGRLSRQPQSFGEASQLMLRHNPAVIPRNHKVEEALAAAVEHSDFSVMQRLLAAMGSDAPEHAEYQQPPPQGGCGYQTFCGT